MWRSWIRVVPRCTRVRISLSRSQAAFLGVNVKDMDFKQTMTAPVVGVLARAGKQTYANSA